MQLYHLHVPAGFTVWVSLFCVYLGLKAIEGGKKKYIHAAIIVIINYNSILNVTATELLYNWQNGLRELDAWSFRRLR